MKLIDILKNIGSGPSRNTLSGNTYSKNTEPEIQCKPCADLSKYEIRRPEIIDGTGIISGIFYIYNGEIIPDYYSETIQPKIEDERSEERYHSSFFSNYMKKKYSFLSDKRENSIPRGRVETNVKDTLFIDQCYSNDEKIIQKICELYRISADNFLLVSNSKYSCDNCRDKRV